MKNPFTTSSRSVFDRVTERTEYGQGLNIKTEQNMTVEILETLTVKKEVKSSNNKVVESD